MNQIKQSTKNFPRIFFFFLNFYRKISGVFSPSKMKSPPGPLQLEFRLVNTNNPLNKISLSLTAEVTAAALRYPWNRSYWVEMKFFIIFSIIFLFILNLILLFIIFLIFIYLFIYLFIIYHLCNLYFILFIFLIIIFNIFYFLQYFKRIFINFFFKPPPKYPLPKTP